MGYTRSHARRRHYLQTSALIALIPNFAFAQITQTTTNYVNPLPLADTNCSGATYSTNFANGLSGWTNDNYSPAGLGSTQGNMATLQNMTAGGINLMVMPASGISTPYYGSRINTRGMFSQTYGVFQVDATLPSPNGSGISAAFWMIPEDGSWPPELDVFEFDSSQGNSVETGYFTPPSAQQTYKWQYNLPAGAHVFTADWEPDNITWYIDGSQVFQAPTPQSFNKPMFMILDNMATEGGWNGSPNPGTTVGMQVTGVQVFGSINDALACVKSGAQPSSTVSISGLASLQSSPQTSQAQTPANPLSGAEQSAIPPAIQQQLNDLNQQIANVQQQTNQIAPSGIPQVTQTSTVPNVDQPFTGYDPRFIDAAHQMQGWQSQIQQQMNDANAQIEQLNSGQLPAAPNSNTTESR